MVVAVFGEVWVVLAEAVAQELDEVFRGVFFAVGERVDDGVASRGLNDMDLGVDAELVETNVEPLGCGARRCRCEDGGEMFYLCQLFGKFRIAEECDVVC